MIAESGVGRFAHVDKDGKLVKEIPMVKAAARKLGSFGCWIMVIISPAQEQPGVVTEYDTEGQGCLGISYRHAGLWSDSFEERQHADRDRKWEQRH